MTTVRSSRVNIYITFHDKPYTSIDVDGFSQQIDRALDLVRPGEKKHLHFDVTSMQVPAILVSLRFAKAMTSRRERFREAIEQTLIHGADERTVKWLKFFFRIYKPATEVVFI